MFLISFISSGLFMFFETIRLSKYASWYLALVPLFLLFSMLGFNRMSRDYGPYQTAFTDDWYRSNFEIGYATLVELLRDSGHDHTAIVFIVGLIFLGILLKYLKNNNHVNLVIFFYSTYPLIYDINQTRNTLMYFIVIFSLGFIVNQKPIKHYLALALAVSMHSFAVVYVPFYFLCKLSRKNFVKIMIGTTLILFLTSPLIIQILVSFFPYKMSVYLNHQPSLGQFILFLYAFIDIFTIWWIDKRISPRMEEKDRKKMEVLYRFIWFPIIILPFSFYFITVLRLQRNALLVKYIYSALAMKYMTVTEKLITVFLLFISLGCYVFLISDLELFQYLNENYIQEFFEKYILVTFQ